MIKTNPAQFRSIPERITLLTQLPFYSNLFIPDIQKSFSKLNT